MKCLKAQLKLSDSKFLPKISSPRIKGSIEYKPRKSLLNKHKPRDLFPHFAVIYRTSNVLEYLKLEINSKLLEKGLQMDSLNINRKFLTPGDFCNH